MSSSESDAHPSEIPSFNLPPEEHDDQEHDDPLSVSNDDPPSVSSDHLINNRYTLLDLIACLFNNGVLNFIL